MSLADFPALLDRLEQGAAAGDVPALKRLAETAPGHVTAHVALARACEQAGQWEEARRSWQRAYLLLPSSPAVRVGLQRTASHAAGEAPEKAASEGPDKTPIAKDAAAEKASPQATSASEKREDQEAPPTLGSKALEDLVAASPEDADVGAHDHLDGLIEELEGARIEPKPNPDDVPAPDLDADAGDMVSPTLARIYEAQGQYAEAARVYRRLAKEHPDRADEHRRQAEAMQARADEEREGEEASE